MTIRSLDKTAQSEFTMRLLLTAKSPEQLRSSAVYGFDPRP